MHIHDNPHYRPMTNKGGRKKLGENKRAYSVKVRFNPEEKGKLKQLVASYNLDFEKRGVVGPFLRKIILNTQNEEQEKLPDSFSKLIFQINKIGNNINQLTKVANYKNLRSPSSKMEREIQISNQLMREILDLLNNKLT